MRNLKKLEPYVRKQIGQSVTLRLTPEIRFEYDDSLEEADLVSEGGCCMHNSRHDCHAWCPQELVELWQLLDDDCCAGNGASPTMYQTVSPEIS